MAYKVRVTDKAKTDLDEIIRYIAEKLSNVTAAANLLADFVKQKNNLQNSPYMYPLCNDIKLQKKGYHRFLFYKKGIYDILSFAILYHYKVNTYMANPVNYFFVLQSPQVN